MGTDNTKGFLCAQRKCPDQPLGEPAININKKRVTITREETIKFIGKHQLHFVYDHHKVR